MATFTNTITWYHPETDEQYTITGTIYLGCKAPFDPMARSQEPDDPDELEITEVLDSDGLIVLPDMEFTEEMIREIESKLMEF